MLEKLKPKLYVDSIHDIDFAKLKVNGIKGIIIDLDNTITEWNNCILPEKAIEWFKKIPENNLKACVVSNNDENRVFKAANKLGIPYVAKANKPRRGAFRKAMDIMGTSSEETAVVGDQIFTDILGGNRLDLFTILVVPLTPKEFIGTRVVRMVERKILKKMFLNKS